MWPTIFTGCTYGVLPFWLLLVFAPHWRGTQWLVHSALVPLAGVGWYALGLFTDFTLEGDALTTLAGVQAALTRPHVAVAAWIHYLIFDLFIGAWQARDAQREGIPHWAVVPCLALTLFAGPIGLALYLGIRLGRRRRWSTREHTPGAGTPADAA